MSTPLLQVVDLDNGYGMSQVLFGMHLCIHPGQCVSLMGRNGMGKSTTVKSIMGLLPARNGQVLWKGAPIQTMAPHHIAKAGIGLVPEGRQIFPNLSVRENLVATAIDRPQRKPCWTLQRVYQLFPRLLERASNFGNQISGGEQQMLAIGRALLTNPELLILDEATEGLSPLIRQEIWAALALLRSEGMAILLIDKNIGPVLRLADHHTIIQKGQVIWSGPGTALVGQPELMAQYLSA